MVKNPCWNRTCPAAAKGSRAKKEKRSVPTGIIHIQSSFNNTIVTVTDNDGNVLKMIPTGQIPTGVAVDAAGKVGIDYGVYGVPETYVIDGQGLIRYRWIGPLTPEALTGILAGEIEKAKTPPMASRRPWRTPRKICSPSPAPACTPAPST